MCFKCLFYLSIYLNNELLLVYCSAIDYRRTDDIDMSPYYREVLAQQVRPLFTQQNKDIFKKDNIMQKKGWSTLLDNCLDFHFCFMTAILNIILIELYSALKTFAQYFLCFKIIVKKIFCVTNWKVILSGKVISLACFLPSF